MDNIVRYNEVEKKPKKSNKPKTILEMMEDDWITFKSFVKEKRKYIFWIVVFFITISFVDVLSLGNSWENAYSNGLVQKGGDVNAAPAANAPPAPAANAPAPNAPKTNAPATPKTNTPNAPEAPNKPKNMKNQKSNAQDSLDSGTKDTKKKGKMGKKKGVSGSPTSMFLGNGIGVVKRAFMMFATILMIAGALSVPFLLIIIATYTIIKMIAKHFMLL